METRTVIVEGEEKPFSELKNGDVFTIVEPDGEKQEQAWLAVSDIYETEGVLGIDATEHDDDSD